MLTLRKGGMSSQWTDILLLLACFFCLMSLYANTNTLRPPPTKHTHTPTEGFFYIQHFVACSSTQPSDGKPLSSTYDDNQPGIFFLSYINVDFKKLKPAMIFVLKMNMWKLH